MKSLRAKRSEELSGSCGSHEKLAKLGEPVMSENKYFGKTENLF